MGISRANWAATAKTLTDGKKSEREREREREAKTKLTQREMQ